MYNELLTREELYVERNRLIKSIENTFDKLDCDEDRQNLLESLNGCLRVYFKSNEMMRILRKNKFGNSKSFQHILKSNTNFTDYDLSIKILESIYSFEQSENIEILFKELFNHQGVTYITEEIKEFLFYFRNQCIYIQTQPSNYVSLCREFIQEIKSIMNMKCYVTSYLYTSTNLAYGVQEHNNKVNKEFFLNMKNKIELTNKDRKMISQKYIKVCRERNILPLIGDVSSEVLRTYGISLNELNMNYYNEMIEQSLYLIYNIPTLPCNSITGKRIYEKEIRFDKETYDLNFFRKQIENNISPLMIVDLINEFELEELKEKCIGEFDNILYMYLSVLSQCKKIVKKDNLRVTPFSIYNDCENLCWRIHYNILCKPLVNSSVCMKPIMKYIDDLRETVLFKNNKELNDLYESLTIENNSLNRKYKKVFSESDYYKSVQTLDKILRSNLVGE